MNVTTTKATQAPGSLSTVADPAKSTEPTALHTESNEEVLVEEELLVEEVSIDGMCGVY
jgi:mycofactocin precursor